MAAAFIAGGVLPVTAWAHGPAEDGTQPRAAMAGAEAQPGDVLPDLVADPPEQPILQETLEGSPDERTRLLLRFDGFIHNRSGSGPFGMVGTGPSSLAMTSVVQTIQQTDGTWRDRPALGADILYETADGHEHWHLKEIARYSLWQGDASAEVAPAMKAGFCLYDADWAADRDPAVDRSTRFYGYYPAPEPGDPPREGTLWTNCANGKTIEDTVPMGVSAGWRDIYTNDLFFQWVDVSDVAPGDYKLASEIDPNGVILESGEVNPVAYTDVVISGYVATPDAFEVALGGSKTIQLGADDFAAAGETLGDPRYKIEELPEHGRLLDQDGEAIVPGKWFADRFVTFIPDETLTAPVLDDLRFSVREAVGTGVAQFPRHAPAATVLIDIGDATAPRIAISGEQDLVAGTSRRLTAAVHNADPASVVWSVATPAGGTIDATGLYVAPTAVPPAGTTVTVRATLPDGTYDEATFAVAPRPADKPAPSPPQPEEALPAVPQPVLPPPAPPSAPNERSVVAPPGTKPVTKPTPALRVVATRNGKRVSASILSRYSGKATMSLMRGSKKIARCALNTRAQRTYVCQLPVGRHTGAMRVTVSLKRPAGQVLVRSAAVTAARRR